MTGGSPGRSALPPRQAADGPRRRGPHFLLFLGLFLSLLTAGCSDTAEVVLASTTSTEDSGLFDVLLPAFREAHPQYRVKLIAVGSGQALALGARRDADVLLVHAPAAEAEFMAAGHGAEHRPVMHNRFLLLAPVPDPAGARAATDACDALRRIAAARSRFVSRGDGSGTHRKEQELWQCAGIVPQGSWYVDVGQGMAETLAIASEQGAYTLADEATYLALDPAGLRPLPGADSLLRNPYSVILVRGARHAEGARAFADWLSGPAQSIIATFGSERAGRPLFQVEP